MFEVWDYLEGADTWFSRCRKVCVTLADAQLAAFTFSRNEPNWNFFIKRA